MMYDIFVKVTELIESIGYIGIFIMTFIESTFIPVPSDITIIPAGYLVSQGRMSGIGVWLASLFGTIGGSMFNYLIARKYGRMLFLNYGEYFFMNEKKLKSIEFFFEKHGAISTFTGRLLPGIKHFISFPAGLAKMNAWVFILYTSLGGGLYNSLLIAIGYFIGQNKEAIKEYMLYVNIIIFLFITLFIGVYLLRKNRGRGHT